MPEWGTRNAKDSEKRSLAPASVSARGYERCYGDARSYSGLYFPVFDLLEWLRLEKLRTFVVAPALPLPEGVPSASTLADVEGPLLDVLSWSAAPVLTSASVGAMPTLGVLASPLWDFD
jgi:hypothetical protein